MSGVRQKLLVAVSFAQNRWLRRLHTRAAVERFQARHVKKHGVFLRQHSPYFRDRPLIRSVEDLEQYPLMDKAMMMAEFNALNTRNLDRDTALDIAIQSEKTRDFQPMYNGVSVGLSSGTSGHRGLFAISDEERYAWAGAVLARFLPKGQLRGHRIAFFLRANNNLYETVKSRFITFQYFDTYRPMAEHIDTLRDYQPTVLVAPPSVLNVIASAVESGELVLKPDKIVAVAEVLTPFDQRRFKEVFGHDIIFQAYQCTEGFLAYTCPHGSLHLNEDIVYFEKDFLDDRRFVPILTDFRRRTQPIVRYRLNDVLVLADKPCTCGNATTVIERIEGREDDIFLFPSVTGGRITVFSDMIERCLLYCDGVTDYRVVQVAADKVTVYVDPANTRIHDEITREFMSLSSKLGFVMPEMNFQPYAVEPGVKLKRVERRWSPRQQPLQ